MGHGTDEKHESFGIQESNKRTRRSNTVVEALPHKMPVVDSFADVVHTARNFAAVFWNKIINFSMAKGSISSAMRMIS